MAFAADIHFQRISFLGRAGLERCPARTGHRDLMIIGMYIGFHAFTSPCLLSFIKMLTYYILFSPASQIKSCPFAKKIHFFAIRHKSARFLRKAANLFSILHKKEMYFSRRSQRNKVFALFSLANFSKLIYNGHRMRRMLPRCCETACSKGVL